MNKNKISILHYTGPPVIGGVESTILHHSLLLNEAGFSVEVIAGRGEKFQSEINFHSIPLIDSTHPKILNIGAVLATGIVPDSFNDLVITLQEELENTINPGSLIIAHNIATLHKNLPLTAALWNLVEGGRSLVAWCHDFAWKDRLYTTALHSGYPWNLLSQPWSNTTYVVVSRDRQSKLAQLFGIPRSLIQVITPGIDLIIGLGISSQTKEIYDACKLNSATPIILLPARITRRKNIEYAIEMMATLVQEFSSAHLLVTGPPGPHNPTNIEYLNGLVELRKNLELEKNISFLYQLGKEKNPFILSDQMVAELFQIADILFFPSKSEGFGIPVLEAGLTRLPVFASDIPPVQESSGGFAHTFNLDDNPSIVANEISRFLQNDTAYNLRKRVINHYTWDAIVNQQIKPLIMKVIQA